MNEKYTSTYPCISDPIKNLDVLLWVNSKVNFILFCIFN